ncbi:c6 transcription factor [Trichoderma arundinaceum]|uniref:C6 transcription factor n=1 Tax=Trichoderma arundinaceum TaxID=490622 RepID=A0A395NYQ6_TRIAR|nr:c6 transcription factor [Trichoderma arundinaceum]
MNLLFRHTRDLARVWWGGTWPVGRNTNCIESSQNPAARLGLGLGSCDLRKDGCGQCLRASIACCGYRDSNELIFRDQTRSVQRKMLASKATTASLQFGALNHVILPNANGIPPQPHLAWNVRARHDFFAHYVYGLSSSYDILPAFFEKAKPGDHLSASVDAASLAFLANKQRFDSKDILRLAAEHYMVALRRINAALSDPELAGSDSVLQSVLLLDLYEKMMGRDLTAAAPWVAHLNGALALIKARGYNDMTKTEVSRKLANKLFTTLLISCYIACSRIPEGVLELGRRLDIYHDKDDVKWRLSKMNERMINFRIDIEEGKLTNSEIIAEALSLDDAYSEIEETASQRWQPTHVMASDEDPENRHLIFGDHYDVYRDHFSTQVRNTVRIMHLQLQAYIQTHLEDDGSEESIRTRLEARIRTERYAEQCIDEPRSTPLGDQNDEVHSCDWELTLGDDHGRDAGEVSGDGL